MTGSPAVLNEYTVPASGRVLTPGREFSVSGVAGRFRFQSYDPRGWINAYGGRPGAEALRAFRPERITVVHHTTKMKGQA